MHESFFRVFFFSTLRCLKIHKAYHYNYSVSKDLSMKFFVEILLISSGNIKKNRLNSHIVCFVE